MHRTVRRTLTLALAGSCLFLIGARCVENDSVRRGPDGNWHIYGELFNETDVQGGDMLVQGSIFDAQGNLLATATAPTCPGELSPGKPILYDITLPNTQGLAEPASHKITVANGAALPEPLPELEIAPEILVSKSGTGHKITVRLEQPSQYTGTFFACIALYGPGGDVIGVAARDQSLVPQSNGRIEIVRFVDGEDYPDAATARVWLYLSDGTVGSTAFQPYVSNKVTIRLLLNLPPQLPVVTAIPQ